MGVYGDGSMRFVSPPKNYNQLKTNRKNFNNTKEEAPQHDHVCDIKCNVGYTVFGIWFVLFIIGMVWIGWLFAGAVSKNLK